ncbi:hypothetical protein [uncultured Mediterranean phage uvMED]|nr:hypothetical protein [uncultured Mediterranean phage uvMED]
MTLTRETVENKLAELETAKKNKFKAEGQVFSANYDLENAMAEVENLTEMVKGLKLLIAENEFVETGCRTPNIHFNLIEEECDCKYTYFLSSSYVYSATKDNYEG